MLWTIFLQRGGFCCCCCCCLLLEEDFYLFQRTVAHLNVLTSPVSKLCPRSIVLILLAKNIFELTAQTVLCVAFCFPLFPFFQKTREQAKDAGVETRGLRLNCNSQHFGVFNFWQVDASPASVPRNGETNVYGRKQKLRKLSVRTRWENPNKVSDMRGGNKKK